MQILDSILLSHGSGGVESQNLITELFYPLLEGCVNSSDNFYYDESVMAAAVDKSLNQYHCLCAEMESFALFEIANHLNKKAACILSVTDSLVKPEQLTPQERQTALVNMIKLGLEAAIKL